MSIIPSKQAKNNFGELLETAQREPVTIQKNGRNVAVILSIQDYERLTRAEDQRWARRARKAEKLGFASAKSSDALLQKLINEAG